MVIDDSKPNPSAVRSQLREMEDYNLAMRLQDEEFGIHYDQNRSERRTVGSDTRHTKVVQQTEDEVARSVRRQAFRQIEETDAQVAQRLAAEWNAEESRQAEEKLRQELIDEEIARRLAESGDFAADLPSSSTPYDQPSQEQQLPSHPPSYDFAVREPQPQQRDDLLVDFAPQQSGVPPSSTTQPVTPARKGIALPGMASPPASVLPPPVSTARLVSQPSLDIPPVAWPAPPPSVLGSNLAPNNPFLADLVSSNHISVGPPSVAPMASTQSASQPPPIGFHSEFGLPPPSSLALGFSGVDTQQQQQ